MQDGPLLYIFWALLCVPILTAAVIFFLNIFDDAFFLAKKREGRSKKAQLRRKKLQAMKQEVSDDFDSIRS